MLEAPSFPRPPKPDHLPWKEVPHIYWFSVGLCQPAYGARAPVPTPMFLGVKETGGVGEPAL